MHGGVNLSLHEGSGRPATDHRWKEPRSPVPRLVVVDGDSREEGPPVPERSSSAGHGEFFWGWLLVSLIPCRILFIWPTFVIPRSFQEEEENLD